MDFPRWVAPAARAVVAVFTVAALAQVIADESLRWHHLVAAVLVYVAADAEGRLCDRQHPLAAVVAAIGVAVGTAILADGNPHSFAWIIVVFIGGQIGVTLSTRLGTAAFAGVMAVMWVADVLTDERLGWNEWGSGVLTGFLGGVLFRKQAEFAARSRVAEAAAERSRIAGELHDVVAHTLAVTVLHLGAARVAIEHEPERAAEALGEAERLARTSMGELRRIVGSLADADGDAPPAPTAAGVVTLVDEYRRAGVTVELRVDGELAAVDAPRGLVVYRLVQEALANAVRHAPGAPVLVDLAVRGTQVTARVANPLPAGAVAGAGRGVAGMRARAEAVGGTADAGPAGDEWRVEASLPTGAGA